MTAPTSTRPTVATILAIWLFVVFCWNTFALVSAAFLSSLRPDVVHMPPAQLALGSLSAALALAGGITLWQMKPVAWHLLLLRVTVDLIALVLVVKHPAALPAALVNNPNAAAITAMAKTTGTLTGIFMVLVNLGIALYARTATTQKAEVTESTPAAA